MILNIVSRASLLDRPCLVLLCCGVGSRAYRPAEGGERACNSRTASTEGEMLAVTKFRTEI